MSATKHTPGRWFVWSGTSDASLNVSSEARDHAYVCLCGRETDLPDDEARANANLIAAAPNLLEALKTTASNIRSIGPAGAIPWPYQLWLETVEAAIAKAEGMQ